MDPRVVRAGIGASLVGLITGALLGTYGGWEPVFNLASTQLGSWLIALALGVIVAYIYGFWFNAFLPGTPVIRGAIYGVLLWVLMLILGGVSAFFKEATYPAGAAGQVAFLALLTHVVWGAVLGVLYEAR